MVANSFGCVNVYYHLKDVDIILKNLDDKKLTHSICSLLSEFNRDVVGFRLLYKNNRLKAWMLKSLKIEYYNRIDSLNHDFKKINNYLKFTIKQKIKNEFSNY